MSESKIIENFIDDPVPLSLFSNPDNPWPDFLALFHLLLIKHGEKKFHLVHNDLEYFESLCNLAKSLDLSWKIVHGKSFHNFEKSTELPEIIKNELKIQKNGKETTVLVIAKDENTINSLENLENSHMNIGKWLEYPICCSKWFEDQQLLGYKEVIEFLMKNQDIENINEVENISEAIEAMEYHFESNVIAASSKRIAKIQRDHIGESRFSMPFIFFQPCDVCIGPSSPARKLNKRYSDFAKSKYPQLHKLIIEEGKKDAKYY
jgi:hypothetical protein